MNNRRINLKLPFKLSVTFPGNIESNPIVFIENNGIIEAAPSKKTTQFLCVLMYHCLMNINDGWVEFEDLIKYSYFRSFDKKALRRFYNDRLKKQPDVVQAFIQAHVIFDPKGHAKLIYPPEFIEVEIALLKKYLQRIQIDFKSIIPNDMDFETKILEDPLNFDYKMIETLLHSYIKTILNSKKIDSPKLVRALLFKSNLYRNGYGHFSLSTRELHKAKRFLNDIQNPTERSILTANIFASQALNMNVLEKSDSRIFNYIKKSIDEIDHLHHANEEKILLKAGRYHQLGLMYVKNGDYILGLDYLSKAMAYYEVLDSAPKPKYTYWIPGVEDFIEHHIRLECILKTKQPLPQELYAWHKELVNNPHVSKELTLYSGKEIFSIYIQNNNKAQALDFGIDCLLEHPELHQGYVYKHLYKQIRNLRSEIA